MNCVISVQLDIDFDVVTVRAIWTEYSTVNCAQPNTGHSHRFLCILKGLFNCSNLAVPILVYLLLCELLFDRHTDPKDRTHRLQKGWDKQGKHYKMGSVYAECGGQLACQVTLT